MRTGLVLLNKNEEISLASLLPQINQNLFSSVFCVDGNSRDSSQELIRSYGIPILIQTSTGRGNAFKIAFEEASKQDLDALVFLSTDGNENPHDLSRHLALLSSGADLTIASRMMRESFNEEDNSLFRPRKWANKLFMWCIYLAFAKGQIRITDPINGYRAIRREVWTDLNLDAEGFDIEFQMSIRAYKARLRVSEFPTIEGPRIGGKSGATAIKTTKRLISIFVRELFKD